MMTYMWANGMSLRTCVYVMTTRKSAALRKKFLACRAVKVGTTLFVSPNHNTLIDCLSVPYVEGATNYVKVM